MTVVPIAEYGPDQPDLSEATDTAWNVVPRTSKSYGPMPSLGVYSSAINARCQGAIATTDTAGNVFNIAGTAAKLYTLSAGTTWTDATRAAGAYSTASDARWSFATMNGKLVASNFTDAMQLYTPGVSTVFADLSGTGTPPKARYLTSLAKGFLVVANTFDGTTGNAPQRVWWSGFGDPTSWPTPGSNAALAAQSDYQDCVGDHGWAMGIVGNLGTADAAIFFERAVFRMVYTGPPSFFSFAPAENVRGTPAPGSIAQLGSTVFYLGEDGFYAFDGSNSTPIGAGKVDKTFLADVDQSYFHRVSSAVDPVNKIVVWAYAGANHSGGNPNRLLVFNWELGRWSLIVDVTLEVLVRALSLGVTLEGLDAFGTIETLAFSLDSRSWTGNRLLLAAFDTSHKLGYFTGANLAATVDTNEAALFDGRRSRIISTRPLVDGGTPSVAVGSRDRTMDSLTWNSAVAVDRWGRCPQRATGRYLRGRITIPAATTFTHISGLDVEARPEGKR